MTDTMAGEAISDAQAMIVGKAILDAHGVWEIENNRKGGQNPWQREHCMTLGRAATLAAQPSAGAQGEVVGWVSEWTGMAGVLCREFHNSEVLARKSAKWMHGRSYAVREATPSQPDTGAKDGDNG